jgi:hypothetical protein
MKPNAISANQAKAQDLPLNLQVQVLSTKASATYLIIALADSTDGGEGGRSPMMTLNRGCGEDTKRKGVNQVAHS